MYIHQFKEISEKELWSKVEKSKDLHRLAKKYLLSEDFICKVDEYIKDKGKKDEKYNLQYHLIYWWRHVAWYQPMSEQFILNNLNKFSWSNVSCNQYLKDDFIRNHSGSLIWKNLSVYVPLSETIIEEYAYRVNWKYIFLHQNLSENFILKNQDKINWFSLMKNKHLAKDFFERNKHLITVKLYANDLVNIIKFQQLSEDTLQEIKKGKMTWTAISENGNLTRDFVIKNYGKLDTRKIMRNRKIDFEVRQEVEMIEKLSSN